MSKNVVLIKPHHSPVIVEMDDIEKILECPFPNRHYKSYETFKVVFEKVEYGFIIPDTYEDWQYYNELGTCLFKVFYKMKGCIDGNIIVFKTQSDFTLEEFKEFAKKVFIEEN